MADGNGNRRRKKPQQPWQKYALRRVRPSKQGEHQSWALPEDQVLEVFHRTFGLLVSDYDPDDPNDLDRRVRHVAARMMQRKLVVALGLVAPEEWVGISAKATAVVRASGLLPVAVRSMSDQALKEVEGVDDDVFAELRLASAGGKPSLYQEKQAVDWAKVALTGTKRVTELPADSLGRVLQRTGMTREELERAIVLAVEREEKVVEVPPGGDRGSSVR